jgi:hypothetical protein
MGALPDLMKPNDKMVLMPYEATSLLGSLTSIKHIFEKIKS